MKRQSHKYMLLVLSYLVKNTKLNSKVVICYSSPVKELHTQYSRKSIENNLASVAFVPSFPIASLIPLDFYSSQRLPIKQEE